MKKLLSLFFLCACSAMAAVQGDFVRSIDLTGTNRISASVLNNLIDSAHVAWPKGLMITSNNPPDIATFTYQTNALWRDISLGYPGTLKTWSGSAWVAATIGVGGVSSVNLAQASVTAGKLDQNSVNTTNITDNAVTDTKITAGAVTSNKLASASVTSDKIVDGTIATVDIGANQITTALIADSQVTSNKVATGAIGGANMATGGVTSNQLASASVTDDKIVTGTVTVSRLNPGTGTNGQVLRLNGTTPEWGTSQIIYRSAATAFTANSFTVVGLSNVTHNLGSTPDLVKITLVNKANNAGANYTVGDEIPVEHLGNNSNFQPAFIGIVNSTVFNVNFFGGGAYTFYYMAKTGANITSTTAQLVSDWNVKITLIRFQ